MADVSVVIPVYNHERYVTAAIESVLSQDVRPREILCIDDGSTDGSARVLESIATNNPLVRCWSRPNQGAHNTLNEGLRAAVGRYIAILNSDDVFHPTRLARCLSMLESSPGVDVVASRVAFIDASGALTQNRWYDEACAFHEQIGDLGLALVNANFLMTTSNIVARREVIEQIGAFDDLRYAHDLDFFLRLIVHGKKIALLPQRLLSYRFHAGNTISESHDQVREEWAVVAAFFAHRVADRRPPDYLSRLLKVTDRHRLNSMIALALLRAQASSAGLPTPGGALADKAFRSALKELVQ